MNVHYICLWMNYMYSSMFLVSIVGSLRDREVACSASDRQGSNFESCVWRTVSSQSSHHPQDVLLAQFSLYVHKGGLKPDSIHFVHEIHELLTWTYRALFMNDQELRWFHNEPDKPPTLKLSSWCAQTKFMLMFMNCSWKYINFQVQVSWPVKYV